MKKIFILILAAMMLLTACGKQRGDVDRDGDIDMQDATIVMLYVNGEPVDLDVCAADVNGDGSVTEADAEAIMLAWVDGEE